MNGDGTERAQRMTQVRGACGERRQGAYIFSSLFVLFSFVSLFLVYLLVLAFICQRG